MACTLFQEKFADSSFCGVAQCGGFELNSETEFIFSENYEDQYEIIFGNYLTETDYHELGAFTCGIAECGIAELNKVPLYPLNNNYEDQYEILDSIATNNYEDQYIIQNTIFTENYEDQYQIINSIGTENYEDQYEIINAVVIDLRQASSSHDNSGWFESDI